MDMRVQGYENQVKLFLTLLVLFLVSAGLIGLNALHRTQALLVEEAEGRIVSISRAVQRELAVSGDPAGRLLELARAFSLSSIELIGRDGRVQASTQPWRVGIVDPLGREVALYDDESLTAARPVIRETGFDSDDEYGPDRGEVLVFLPIETADPGTATLVKVGHQILGVRTVARQIRWLAWMQAIAGVVVLILVGLFVQWVLRPYRALKAAAAQLGARAESETGATSPIDDPQEMIASFRGVIEKLKEQELELGRMRAMAEDDPSTGVSQELLDGLTSGVLIIEEGGEIARLNPAGERILGIGRETVTGRDFREVFSGSPRLLEILSDGVERGRTHSREVVPHGSDRTGPVHLGVTVSSIPSDCAQGGGVFCLFSDLTEIRGLQELVRLKENLAGLGELSAGIAHEFRNSLATILGYARLILRESGPSHGAGVQCGESASAIVREVESIGRIVNDFLRYARPAALAASDWDPRSVVEEVARETARDCGRPDVRIVLGGSWPGSIRADETLMRQAFQNILRNAVEAIQDGPGTVTVTGSIEEQGDTLRIEVADSGTGIPPEVLSRLFTPFATTKDTGTGLGLAMAQKAVVSHDGAITARNASEGGACFTITLPCRR